MKITFVGNSWSIFLLLFICQLRSVFLTISVVILSVQIQYTNFYSLYFRGHSLKNLMRDSWVVS